MLTPEYLRDLPEAILRLYCDAELRILADMARRLAAYDYWVPAAEHQKRALREAGRTHDEIVDALAKTTGKSDQELRQMMQEASTKALESDAAEYTAAGLESPSIQGSKRLRDALNAGYKATQGTMRNLAKTTAKTASQQFERALDRAWVDIRSGAIDYSTAIRNAIKDLSKAGVQAIRYPTGHTDSLEVAVRRAVVTGANQTALQLQWSLADEMGCDLVETTAHAGARPSHAEWQGQIFSRSGKSTKYPDFRAATGYGTGAGLGGWNCRHSYHPYFEGAPRAYSKDQLEQYNAKDYTYNGQRLTEYDATQIQRYNERQMRRWQREQVAIDAAGLDTSEATGKLRQWRDTQADFLRQTGLKQQYEREKISGKPFTNPKKQDKIRSVTFDDKQFGKKVGKHAADFGLSAGTPEDRAKMKQVILDIVDHADEKVGGEWRGQEEAVLFHIKGSDVVVTRENGEFVTVLKGGAENARVKKARGQQI